VIRIAFTEEWAEEIPQQQRTHTGKDPENVAGYDGRRRGKRGK
jgi:hypothetical protein